MDEFCQCIYSGRRTTISSLVYFCLYICLQFMFPLDLYLSFTCTSDHCKNNTVFDTRLENGKILTNVYFSFVNWKMVLLEFK